MLKGIDISSWQDDIDLRKVIVNNSLDFVIIKATEGAGFVEKTCDYWVQTCISNGTLWGFYHYAYSDGNAPEDEAMFFYEACKNYFGHGIPILDIETDKISDWGNWCQRFIDKIHALTGIYPMIYTSSAFMDRFEKTKLPATCGMWVAQYPYYAHGFDNITYEDGSYPWPFIAIWQFTSQGQLSGYTGYLDLDYAYMNRAAWLLYAGAKPNTNVDNKKHWTFENDYVKIEVTIK